MYLKKTAGPAYLEAGIDELADKPVKPDTLFAAIVKWLSP